MEGKKTQKHRRLSEDARSSVEVAGIRVIIPLMLKDESSGGTDYVQRENSSGKALSRLINFFSFLAALGINSKALGQAGG